MSSDFLIVHKKILPDYLEKVIEARNMLEAKEAATVTEAVQKAGISRNTYYKYKDYVFPYDDSRQTRRAVSTLIVKDESGALSAILTFLSAHSISILTISQAVPIAQKANVLLSLDISHTSMPMETLIQSIRQLPSVKSAHLDAME